MQRGLRRFAARDAALQHGVACFGNATAQCVLGGSCTVSPSINAPARSQPGDSQCVRTADVF